jgi:DNA-binding PadR family transcriptional regulator
MSASAPPARGLEIALLGLLREHPRHAYELHQLLQDGAEPLGIIWRLKQSNLYALLAKLEEAGYVASAVELHGARPPRKMLQLTPEGRAAFAYWLLVPVDHGRDFRLEFLAKLYFATQAGARTVRDLLTLQRQACMRWILELRSQLDATESERTFERLIFEFRLTQIEAILRWLDTCEQTLT